jgi:hypothetical protein
MRRRRCVGEGVRWRCRQQGRGALGSLFIGVCTVSWCGAQAERVAATASFFAARVSYARAAVANEVVCRRELKEFRSAAILVRRCRKPKELVVLVCHGSMHWLYRIYMSLDRGSSF